ALALEHVESGSYHPIETLTLPLDALADCDGRDDSPVVCEAADSGATVLRWEDAGIPLSRTYDVPPLETLTAFPERPADYHPAPADLPGARAGVAATSRADSTRYRLDCLQLRDTGAGHEVIGTDGSQLLIEGGFPLPWTGDVLVPGTPACASPVLA